MARAVADDSRIASFAGVAGYYSDASSFASSSPREYQAAIDRGRAAEQRWRDTGSAETIEAVARDGGDVAMPLQEAFEFYGTPRGAVPNYVNGFAVQSLAYTTPFDAQEAAARIRVPFLLVHSEHALVPPLARAFYASVPGSKSELWLESVGQIDFYDDPRADRSRRRRDRRALRDRGHLAQHRREPASTGRSIMRRSRQDDRSHDEQEATCSAESCSAHRSSTTWTWSAATSTR